MKIDLDNLNYSTIMDEEEALRIVNLVSESKKKEEEKEEKENIEEPGGNPVNPDEYEVKYADLNKELENIFEHIIIFTNDDDPKNNKTLKTLLNDFN